MSPVRTQSGEDLEPGHLRVLPPKSDPEVIRALFPMRSASLRGKVSALALDLSLEGGVSDIEAMRERILLLREQGPNRQEEETNAGGH